MRPKSILAVATLVVIVTLAFISCSGGEQPGDMPATTKNIAEAFKFAAAPLPLHTPTQPPAEAIKTDYPQKPKNIPYPSYCFYTYWGSRIQHDIFELEPPQFTDADVDMLARTVWGEARGCSEDEQRLVVWTVLQRVDADRWGDTIAEVVTAYRQFVGYRSGHPICPYIRILVVEELESWERGEQPPTLYPFAPSLPYFYFDGDGRHNWFREHWR